MKKHSLFYNKQEFLQSVFFILNTELADISMKTFEKKGKIQLCLTYFSPIAVRFSSPLIKLIIQDMHCNNIRDT